MQEPTCRGCGARLAYSAADQALKCDYCDTVTPIRQDDEPEEGAPRLIVPLAASEGEVTRAVDTLLASGAYTPDDLLDRAVITRREHVYVPVYVFEGSYEAVWTASFGYDRNEHYTAHETHTENGQTRTVPVTRSRTVTDWVPANGNDAGDFTVTGYAGGRLTGKAAELVETGTVFGRTRAYQSSFTSGLDVEAFQGGDDDVFARRARTQVDALIERNVKAHGQGNSQRDWHWTARITERTATRVLLPVCHVVYEYEAKAYHVWFDGADLRRQAADPLPQDQKRKRSVNLGYVPAVAASVQLFLAGILTEPGGGPLAAVSLSTASIVAGAWMFNAMRAALILSGSRRARAARLAERTAARGASPGRVWRLWPTNRLADIALVGLTTVLFWTAQSHAVDELRAEKWQRVLAKRQAQAAQQLQEARNRAEAEVRGAVFPGQKFEGTSIEAILVAAARDDWATVDTLAHKAPHAAAKARQRGNAERAAIAALRNAPDTAAAWLALATVWCANDQPVLARQGLRLALHFGADRKEGLAELRKLEARFTQPDNRHLRALVADVRGRSNDIP
ncbi:hypothetical protein IA69_24025 [Massilia sp. JS1662]|nr:hypothetical protein [Massilia sp. JS1662]KGF79488.1 hypothetical protein IA69_24025 [Massilia sp. JS1662]